MKSPPITTTLAHHNNPVNEIREGRIPERADFYGGIHRYTAKSLPPLYPCPVRHMVADDHAQPRQQPLDSRTSDNLYYVSRSTNIDQRIPIQGIIYEYHAPASSAPGTSPGVASRSIRSWSERSACQRRREDTYRFTSGRWSTAHAVTLEYPQAAAAVAYGVPCSIASLIHFLWCCHVARCLLGVFTVSRARVVSCGASCRPVMAAMRRGGCARGIAA